MTLTSRIFPAVAAALLLASCSKSRTVQETETAAQACTACHGGTDNTSGAPPRDTRGWTDSGRKSVGAHTTHVAAGIDCGACHVKPAKVSSPGHLDGRVTLTWGTLATADGNLAPAFDEVTGMCTSVYCHGSFRGGNDQNAPSWISVGQGQAACGTCHAVPPPAPHVQSASCGGCHGAGYSSTTVSAATHVNGQVDFGELACTSCHGDPARAATTLNPRLAAAPPVDTHGEQASTRVGAHQAHLTDGALRGALACTDCHAVPTSTGHSNGTVDFQWSALATDSGAIAPAYAGAGGACSNTYCHGASLGKGGTKHEPAWAGGAAEAGCGTCHAIPPPAPHVQNASCGGCHGAGYSATTVNAATHVNGEPTFGELACTSCHGDPARAATELNPRLAAAPPVDTHGEQASTRVGAHQAHLTDGTLRGALACTDCHAVPTSTGHSNGAVDFQWSALATDSSALTPAYAGAGGACSNTYCHGANLGKGGTEHEPSWAGGAAEAGCGTCHAVPPPAPHVQNTNCGGCHGAGYSATTVNAATHVNGEPTFGELACTSCHGDPARAATELNPRLAAAPPVDTNGEQASTRVGAHQAHLTGGPLRGALACTDCHAVPTSTGHSNGTVDFQWSALATDSGAITPSYAGGACLNTYCHGANLGKGGTEHEPSWAGGAAEAQCGACHAVPPPAPHAQSTSCGSCHGTGYSATTVNAATHVNGQLDVNATSCTSCHGDPARQATALNPQLPAAPPVDTSGNQVSPKVGAHQIHLNGSAISSAIACTQCHAIPSLAGHPTGGVDFAWGTLATGAITPTISTNPSFSGFSAPSAPSYAGGACSATYCHGSYSGTFSFVAAGSDPPETRTISYSGDAAAPSWGGTAACGTCHGAPPSATRTGYWHSGTHFGGNDCSVCHPDAAGTAATGDVRITNPALHIDGKVDLAANFKQSCFGCH